MCDNFVIKPTRDTGAPASPEALREIPYQGDMHPPDRVLPDCLVTEMRKEMNSKRLNRCAPVFPVSRKKILIIAHPPFGGNGLVARTSTHAR